MAKRSFFCFAYPNHCRCIDHACICLLFRVEHFFTSNRLTLINLHFFFFFILLRLGVPITVAVVVAFFVCWAPFHAQRLMASLLTTPTEAQVLLFHLLTNISGVTYYLSATINPILYSIMSAKFRRAFWDTLRCWCWTAGSANVRSSVAQRKFTPQTSRMMAAIPHSTGMTAAAVAKLRSAHIPMLTSEHTSSNAFNVHANHSNHPLASSHPIRSNQLMQTSESIMSNNPNGNSRLWRMSHSSDSYSRQPSTRTSSVYSLNQTFDLNINHNPDSHLQPQPQTNGINTNQASEDANNNRCTSDPLHSLQQMQILEQLSRRQNNAMSCDPLTSSVGGTNRLDNDNDDDDQNQPTSESNVVLLDDETMASVDDKTISGSITNNKRGRFVKRQSTVSLVGSSPIIEEDEGSSRVWNCHFDYMPTIIVRLTWRTLSLSFA